ncbi:MAG: tRNA uridine-5-carboxymethylaminomethyl(34) synthesis enzyme MnmG, partial [Rhodobacteraceae bacterium]|nr:tRNA uridine-5-carboxymethylaminomethyl(34) synthesis enzyme MnmG [Paracoccaceae bacterium]
TPLGLRLGCVGEARARAVTARREALAQARSARDAVSLPPNEAGRHGLPLNADGRRRSGFALLALPEVDFARLAAIWPELAGIAPEIARQTEIDALYAVYVARQRLDAEGLLRDEAQEIPGDIDYQTIGGLSNELKAKLMAVRPRDIAQAARIDGMTPAALVLVLGRCRALARRSA